MTTDRQTEYDRQAQLAQSFAEAIGAALAPITAEAFLGTDTTEENH